MQESAPYPCCSTLTLSVPWLRDAKFPTEFFMHYQRCEKALILAMIKMVVNGLSTMGRNFPNPPHDEDRDQCRWPVIGARADLGRHRKRGKLNRLLALV